MNILIGCVVVFAIIGGIWALFGGLSDNNKRSTSETLRETATGTAAGGCMGGAGALGCFGILLEAAIPIIIILLIFKACS